MYTRFNTAKTTDTIELSLDFITRDVVVDLTGDLTENKGTVTIGDLPSVKSNSTHMRILFQNLINNAIKLHHKDIPPVVSISAAHESNGPDLKIVVADPAWVFPFTGEYAKHKERAKLFDILKAYINKPLAQSGIDYITDEIVCRKN